MSETQREWPKWSFEVIKKASDRNHHLFSSVNSPPPPPHICHTVALFMASFMLPRYISLLPEVILDVFLPRITGVCISTRIAFAGIFILPATKLSEFVNSKSIISGKIKAVQFAMSVMTIFTQYSSWESQPLTEQVLWHCCCRCGISKLREN